MGHLPLELRAAKDLVKIAVKQDWRALGFMHKDLRSETELINLGLKQDGDAFQYAHEDIRCDPKHVQKAMKKNWRAVYHAIGPYDVDIKFWTEVSETFPGLPEHIKKAIAKQKKADAKQEVSR